MKINRLFVISFVVLTLAISLAGAVVPFGAETVTEGASTRAPITGAQSHTAIAGNVTELTIAGSSITQTWQGYFGNVSGTIQLADAAGNAMYDWTLADPEGEVYASLNNSINWSGTKCFDVATKGNALELAYGMDNTDMDGINETFDEKVHPTFYVNNLEITTDTCSSIEVYDSTNASAAGNFEQVILEGGSGEVIWTSILEAASVLGFDGKDHDFEMLVPEDGHGTDVATTTYFFYVELE